MVRLYQNSWELYKAHTESFADDIKYYCEFAGGYKTLELFAGYGRIANQLLSHQQYLEVVEIEPEFAKFIDLQASRKHVCDVLTFEPSHYFERVFAAYNSFCLFVDEADIFRFFQLLDSYLVAGGRASLSYYHPDYWSDAIGYAFEYEGVMIDYVPSFDLSMRETDRTGIWIDSFHYGEQTIVHEYKTKVYETPKDVEKYLDGTSLTLINVVHDFNQKEVEEPGWQDFIFEKQ